MSNYPRCTDDFSKIYVHPIITADQMSVISFTIFQLHQLQLNKKQKSLTEEKFVRRKNVVEILRL